MTDPIALKLIGLGFSKKDVFWTMKDVRSRLRWTLNSECFVFSRSSKQWSDGLVVGVMVDDTANVEWLRVQYDGKKKKSMQRFSDCLQSSGLPADYAVNGQLLQLMADEMRLEPKGQSMESEEAEQVQTVFLCLGTVRFESECLLRVYALS